MNKDTIRNCSTGHYFPKVQRHTKFLERKQTTTMESQNEGCHFKQKSRRWKLMSRKRQHRSLKHPQKHQSHDGSLDPISIDVNVDKNSYEAGSRIRGRVFLFVPQSATGCDDFCSLHLSFEGQETIEFYPSLERYNANIIKIDKEVARFQSPMIAGQYEYPFSLKLPEESLPGSMCCVADEGRWLPYETSFEDSKCEVKYSLKAYLSNRTSKPKWTTTKCKQPIYISGSGIQSSNNITGGGCIVEPKRFEMKSWLRKRGYIELGFDTDTVVASPDSKLTIGITGRNQSSVAIKGLLIQWIEIVKWGELPNCKGHQVLAETTLLADSLPPAWQEYHKGMKKKEDNAVEAASMDNDNSSGIGTERITTQLHLKKNGRDSYKGQIIEVSHSIQITAITNCKHNSDPKITALVKLHQLNQSAEFLYPIDMVEAQLLPLPSISNNHEIQYYGNSQPRIEIPEAVAINIDKDDAVLQDKVEYNQSFAESTKISSSSLSSLSPTMSQGPMLESALVMTVE